MNWFERKSYSTIILIAMGFILISSGLYAEEKRGSATLTDFEGEVYLYDTEDEEWSRVQKEIPIASNDRIKTGPDSFVEILFDDGSMIRLEENTEIYINELEADFDTSTITALLFIKIGRVLTTIKSFSQESSEFRIKTNTAVLGVRGTDFVTETEDEDVTDLGVFNGSVAANGISSRGVMLEESEVVVESGYETRILLNRKPSTPIQHTGKMLS